MLISLVKPISYRTIDVDDCHDLEMRRGGVSSGVSRFVLSDQRAGDKTHLSVHNNRHNNLALRVAVARDMTWERVHVSHELRFGSCRCCTTDSTAECDDLARDFALERSQDELGLFACCFP